MQEEGSQHLTGVIQQFTTSHCMKTNDFGYLQRTKNNLGKRILINAKYFSSTDNETITTYTRLMSDQNSIFVL